MSISEDSPPALTIRIARPDEAAAIAALILKHGPNQWNYLPEADVKAQAQAIARGAKYAVVAESGSALVGAVTFELTRRYPQFQPQGREGVVHGYGMEVVVHRDLAGRGVGTAMLRVMFDWYAAHGVREVYLMHHADNRPSRRMMEKAGLTVVAEFDDPIRTTGTRRTTVVRRLLDGVR